MADLGGAFAQTGAAGIFKRTSPGVKVVAATLFSFTSAILTSWLAGLAALVIGLALVPLSGMRFRKMLGRLVVVNTFVFFLWPVLVFFGQGPWITLGFLDLSEPGLSLAVLITLKSNAIILAFTALVGTMRPHTLGYGLKQLKVPDKLCQLFMFTYRYVHVINEEYIRLKIAAKMRCFKPGTNIHTYRTYAYMVGMLLVKSWDRAIRIRQAMLLRGFTGTYHTLNKPEKSSRDGIMAASFVVICIILIFLNFSGSSWIKQALSS